MISRAAFPLALLLCGCQPPRTGYGAARADCATELAAWSPTLTAPKLVDGLGVGCATTLGATIGMDWESFGFTPSTLLDSETGAYVLAGLFTVLADDRDTAADVLADPDLPELFREELGRAQVAPDATRAELIFTMIRASTFLSVYVDSIPGSPGASANYTASEHKTTFAPPFLGWDRDLYRARPPAVAASVILHESAHRFYGAHITCTENPVADCDPSREGAYGVHIWWLAGWITRYGGEVDEAFCGELDSEVFGLCGSHIENEDQQEWAPCEYLCP